MKPKLINGFDTSDGTVGIIYADQASDLGGAEYVGVEKSGLSSGSIAYDKVLNTYVFNGENWVKDDGTTIPNSAGGLTKFTEFSFTGVEIAPGIMYGAAAPCSFPCLEKLTITFDGVNYEMERKEAESVYYYGDMSGEGMPVFTDYPFVLSQQGTVLVGDGNEHTISINGEVVSFTELVADESVTISGGEGQVSDSEILEAGKSYKLIFDEYVWYGTCNSTLAAKFYNHEDNDDYTELWANEYTGMNWPTNGTYTISLYEMVE